MKVLHLISSGGMYGAEAVILDIARMMQREGHSSLLGLVSTAGQGNAELVRRARAQELETHNLPCSGQLDRTLPQRLRTLVDAAHVDLVHAHGYKADVYAFWALRRAGTPLVSTCHTWYDNDVALRIYGTIDRMVLRRFDAVVAVSDEVETRLLGAGVPKARVHLIRNGVDLTPFRSAAPPASGAPPSGTLTVGLIGRFAPEKGIDLFLRSAARVRDAMPRARFIVAGDGPDRASLEALLRELRLENVVTLAGRQEDMPAFYAGLDLLVSASRQEGLPIALLEGMASALPVVATRVGEIPKVVLDGETGLLVDPESPVALASAILELLGDEGRRRRFGNNARARVEAEFSAARMTADYRQVYERVLQEGRR